MNKAYEMIIVTCLATCEELYLTQLIQSIAESNTNALAVESLNHMKSFTNDFKNKLENIKKQLTDYLSTYTSETDLSKPETDLSKFDNLRSSCDELRHQFHTIHRNFILSIDACTEFHLKSYKNHIKSALSVANIYMTDTTTNDGTKTRIKSLHDFITVNSNPLEPKFKELIESNNISSIAISTDSIVDVQKFINDYASQYAIRLINFKSSIVDKFNFIFPGNLFIKSICDEILNITYTVSTEKYKTEKIKLNKHSLFSYETNDTMQAVNFIHKYLAFFSAPFNDNDQFQSWCKHNEAAISPISDALSNFLNSKDQRVAFERALVGQSDADTDCLKHGDNYRLKVFFSHVSNHELAKFLNSYDDHSVINKWYDDNVYNKKEITHTKTLSYR